MRRNQDIPEEQRLTKKIKHEQIKKKEFTFLEITNVRQSQEIVLDEEGEEIQQVIKKALQDAGNQKHYTIFSALKRSKEKHFNIFLFQEYLNLKQIQQNMLISISSKLLENQTISFQKSQDNKYFIVQPTILISPKTFSGLDYCQRKQYLTEFFKDHYCDVTLKMIQGTITHQFFQRLIQNNQHKLLDQNDPQFRDSLRSEISQIYRKNLGSFCQFEMNLQQMLEVYENLFFKTISWINEYILKNQFLKIVNDIYEDIEIIEWQQNELKISTLNQGLTGKIDLVVQVKYKKKGLKEIRKSRIPIELKTGSKNYMNPHIRNMEVYLFLMSNNLVNCIPPFGLILYLENSDIELVTIDQDKLRRIFLDRNIYVLKIEQNKNNLACCYHDLPKMEIKNQEQLDKKCGQCELQSVCYGLYC